MKQNPLGPHCKPMIYRQHWTPRDYVCSHRGCVVRRVKLWRRDTDLHCVHHAIKQAGYGISDVDRRGEHFNPISHKATNWLGDLRPAIPDQLDLEGRIFSYLPAEELSGKALRWWRTLPLKR